MKPWRALGLALLLASCGGDDATSRTSGDEDERPARRRGPSRAELCTETGDEFLQLPYDTNGDGAADVIRVYRVTTHGGGTSRRIVCREADLNGDGERDTVRYYDDRGRVAREQQDRDFDGNPDYWEVYDGGRIIRAEQDTNDDQRIDTRIYYDLQGRPQRIERDLAGNSTPGNFRPDHFEYFSDGRLTRSGVDLDFDGAVDRWDRDRLYEAERDAREREEEAREAAEAEEARIADGGIRDAGVADAGPTDAGVADSGTRARGADAGARAPTVDAGAGPRVIAVQEVRVDAGVNDGAASAN